MLTLEDAERVSSARSAYDALNANRKYQLTENGALAGLISASGAFAGVILYYKKRRKDTGVEKKEEK